jgi:flavin reductase (DIM6/NTAB) family NADH-FMN oxidoreductase RutF
MYLDATTLSTRDAYRLMIGSIVPRAIAWVSTLSPDGVPNLAPYSFFTGITPSPPSICFSPIHRHGEDKDTLANIRANGEFVVNVVTEDVGQAMNATSEEVGRAVDEFGLANVTRSPSTLVKPFRVAESPINMECRLSQLVEVGREPQASTLVIGEIVAWHLRDDLYDADRVRIAVDRLQAIGRLAGDGYTRTRDQFAMIRPDPTYSGR